MTKRIVMTFVLLTTMAFNGIMASAYDLSNKALVEKHHAFASQYKYKEGDSDKSFELYPDIPYTSGIEYTESGEEFECPALYSDGHAMMLGEHNFENSTAEIVINGVEQRQKGIIYNSRTLVPFELFESTGLETNFDEETLVLTIKNSDTVIEILPYLIGMRKNQSDGFYVPLEVCARFVDGDLYIPLRAVANEFDISVEWYAENFTVAMKN